MTELGPLDPGEESIWSGRPSAVWYACRRAGLAFLIGSLALINALAFILASNRLPAEADPKFAPQLKMTAIIGLGCILAVVWSWLRASRTIYLLTNRRVVIDTAGPISRRTSIPLEHVRFIELRSMLFGPSDLIFIERRRAGFDGWRLRGDGFIAIPDTIRVEELVRRAIDQTFVTRARGPWQ
jgi:hypothetical protein